MSAALQGAGTNYASLVKPLQWLVIVVIFLFFLRVARAVTVQARAPRDAASPRGHQAARTAASRSSSSSPTRASASASSSPSTSQIGRGSQSDLVLDDAFVSGRHASVEYGREGLVLSDLGSTNGTFVNEKMIDDPTRLKRGDVVQIGSFVFEVVR